jgi:adenine phosphoribosyltransferase
VKPDFIVAMEARGFIFGSALAHSLGCGFVPIRKKGKLPYKTFEASYSCEYSSQTLEIHEDAIPAGSKVVVFDDVLATGGTAGASIELIRKLGANIISCDFLIELDFLNGRSKINDCIVNTVLHYQ